MPLATDPGCSFDYVLATDEEKPTEEQPAFIFKYVNGREWRTICAIADAQEEQGSAVVALDELYRGVAVGLIGWRNMKDRKGEVVKFDPDRLDELINPAEANELLWGMLRRMRPGVEDQKKSESQSPTSSAGSAGAVAESDAASGRAS